MFQHIIAISSSYGLGKRIAWHYAAEEIERVVLEELNEKTKRILGRPDYSIHKLTTNSKDWASIVTKDSFFDGFMVYDSLDDFLNEISSDKKISALDIAKFLLSIQPMSNLKLQKMIYLVYADYLSQTKKPLFEEKILAYQFGPLVEEVYGYYKGHGREKIEEEENNDKVVVLNEITVPITTAKILQSDDGQQILSSVLATFEKFGKKTASQLVTITHKPNSPWDRTSHYYQEIQDDVILAYHHIETT